MQFTIATIAAFAALASANTIQFINTDATPKTIFFTPNPDSIGMAPAVLVLGPNARETWVANGPWEGNFFSVNQGAPVIPGMLGEVNFSQPATVFYDVSAIVNPHDNVGVKEIWPASGGPPSGCASYAATCDNAYNAPNDVQTKATTATRDLFCSVGTGASASAAAAVDAAPVKARKVRSHARHFLSHTLAVVKKTL